jgi:hypothetical protein
MAVAMWAPMGIFMLITMPGMFPNRSANIALNLVDGAGPVLPRPGACADAPCLASMIFDLSAGSSIGRVSGL